MLDTSYRVEIPGGIELEARVVGPVARFIAASVDIAIRGTFLFIGLLASIPFGELGFGFWFIIWFVIEWFYPVLFEVFWRGQTPGKRMLGISVIHDDLTPVTFGSSLVRNLLRTVDFLPMMYLTGLIAMLCNQRFQRLGDLAAGTLVISVSHATRPANVEEIEPLAPPISLKREEQTAVIEFLQRSAQLSEPRQQELASILQNVTHQSDENGVKSLHRIGAWFLGMK